MKNEYRVINDFVSLQITYQLSVWSERDGGVSVNEKPLLVHYGICATPPEYLEANVSKVGVIYLAPATPDTEKES